MNDNLVGQQLDEYRLLALLGHGGMARVYLGHDVRLKRYVSIKVISPPFRSDPGYVQRFEREAQAVARLEHPHIVRLYRYGQANGLLYMAMQYVEGADLESLLDTYRDKDQFIPPDDARRIVGEVCQALDYAHARGVIHRDVKPGNILVDRQGHAYLTDFGLAVLAEPVAGEEHFGTPQYMAPEQVLSPAGALPESDLYALGIVLYEMFTGQVPFDGDPAQVAASQVNDPPRAPRSIRPEITPALEAVIIKALAKDPRDRYRSGAELAQALERSLWTMPETSVASRFPAIEERVTAELRRPAAPARHAPPRRSPAAQPAGLPPASPSLRVPAPPRRPSRRRGRGRRLLAILLILLLLALAAAGLLLAQPGGYQFPVWLPIVPGGAVQPTGVAVELTATLAPTDLPPPTNPPATDLPLPTDPPPATDTATVEPTMTPTLTPRPSPVPVPGAGWELVIAVLEDNLLVVANRSDDPFPLPLLRLGEGERAVEGAEWGVESMAMGQCVVVVKLTGRSRTELPPCELVGEGIERRPNDVVWQSEFPVFFEGTQVSTCGQTGCVVQIP